VTLGAFSGDNIVTNHGEHGGIAALLGSDVGHFVPFVGCAKHGWSLLFTTPYKSIMPPNKINQLTPGQLVYMISFCQNDDYVLIRSTMARILADYAKAPALVKPDFDRMLAGFGEKNASRLQRVECAIAGLKKLEMVSESRFTGYADAFLFLERFGPLWLVAADELRCKAKKRQSGSLGAMLRDWIEFSASEELQAMMECFLNEYLAFWRRYYVRLSQRTPFGDSPHFNAAGRLEFVLDVEEDLKQMVEHPDDHFNVEGFVSVLARRGSDDEPADGRAIINCFLQVALSTFERNFGRYKCGIYILFGLANPNTTVDVYDGVFGSRKAKISDRAQQIRDLWNLEELSEDHHGYLNVLLSGRFKSGAKALADLMRGKNADVEQFVTAICEPGMNECAQWCQFYVRPILSDSTPVERGLLSGDVVSIVRHGPKKPGTGGTASFGNLRSDTVESMVVLAQTAHVEEQIIVHQLSVEKEHSDAEQKKNVDEGHVKGLTQQRSVRSKIGFNLLGESLVKISPTSEEYDAGKVRAVAQEKRFKRPRNLDHLFANEFEETKVKSFSKATDLPGDGKKHKGRKVDSLEALQLKGRRLLLPFQNGCFTDGRCLGKGLRGQRREWMGCDSCGAFYHYGCALDHQLFVAPAREKIDFSMIEFFCELCSNEKQ